MTRREILKMTLLGAQLFIPFREAMAEALTFNEKLLSGRLSFFNRHEEESLAVQYLGPGQELDPNALEQLDYFFRCRHTNEVRQIDPRLFLLLDTVRYRLGARERPFQLYSGYRSPGYNRILKKGDRDAARKCFHTQGMAADISLDGVSHSDFIRTAKSLKAGGVGVYDDFLHLDVGPVRSW